MYRYNVYIRDLPIYLLVFRTKYWNIFLFTVHYVRRGYIIIVNSITAHSLYLYSTYLHVVLCKIIEIKRWLRPY